MKKLIFNNKTYALALLVVAATGCKKDFTNPNETPSDVVFKNPITAASAAVGIQRTYTAGQASTFFAAIDANGLTTNELILLNPGNVGENQFSKGGINVDGTNNVLTNIWTNGNKMIFDANNVIRYGEQTTDKPYGAGLISYASIFKALALGNLSMFWEKVPDTIGTIGTPVTFIDRMDGYKKAIRVLDNAIVAYEANNPNATVIGRLTAGVANNGMINALYALKARYALFSGDYDAALAAAEKVDLSKKVVLDFNAQVMNPVYESATSNTNFFQPIDSTLGLPEAIAPEKTDGRILFHTRIKTPQESNPRFRINGFYAALNTAIPVYTPGEIMLIKAEAYARKATPDLGQALIELNKVVTKKPAGDIYGVGADLPALGAMAKNDLLVQIYRNRCIELYMSGMKLEDLRRFEDVLDETLVTRKRNFMPYPFTEKDNNPNTPNDPPF
ncbi:RagB/SusD family nutrient uptake outer membrane protein [Pseudobacter ginsenosidimutans]|uniref:SusD-like starch-binding protein associating with outer membrane n=1 Tax=Pseudobacter ginsenosidimutans TaxID=661488 RepID=A0A4Q7M9T1_9BACT|nr:RagB/SusD family nutrient uptake outer membrane protein [Pseudobacter ginsenosidimutans]QEC42551.1 RagB/SusD family nutrient uptake outer membrane protein [Pseudobacter ginsenosidimutans]RZS63963.1 SusD-like starch-binding protein associating with outer membrane [Pseudobacter ginsenosidimutans]